MELETLPFALHITDKKLVAEIKNSAEKFLNQTIKEKKSEKEKEKFLFM